MWLGFWMHSELYLSTIESTPISPFVMLLLEVKVLFFAENIWKFSPLPTRNSCIVFTPSFYCPGYAIITWPILLYRNIFLNNYIWVPTLWGILRMLIANSTHICIFLRTGVLWTFEYILVIIIIYFNYCFLFSLFILSG